MRVGTWVINTPLGGNLQFGGYRTCHGNFKENIVDGVVRGVSKVGDAVPATMKDLRAVEDVLKKLKQ